MRARHVAAWTGSFAINAAMKEFLHGWRRKAGCVTLIVALMFSAGWLRSYIAHDSLKASLSNCRCESLESVAGCISWFSEIETEDMFGHRSILEWRSRTIDSGDPRLCPLPDGSWRYPFGVHYFHHEDPDWSFTSRMISYWHFTVPLTLMSAYLILWKPRQRSCQQ
jgi:hypothetical protein